MPVERKQRQVWEMLELHLEARGTEIEGNGGFAVSCALNEQMFGIVGARTKLPALLSQSLFSSSHTCAKRLLASGGW